MTTSIGAGFLSRLFSRQSSGIKKLSKWKKDWLEKCLDRKPTPVEVAMYCKPYQTFHYTRRITSKRVTSLWCPSQRHSAT